MSADERPRRRLYSFILINVIEETIMAIIAFIILLVFVPFLLIPGMSIVAIGLVIFTLIKSYYYWSSTSIPVYDPLIGQEGITLTSFNKEGEYWKGKVMVRGEHWKAQASEVIPRETRIWVHGVTGLTLIVKTSPMFSRGSANRS